VFHPLSLLGSRVCRPLDPRKRTSHDQSFSCADFKNHQSPDLNCSQYEEAHPVLHYHHNQWNHNVQSRRACKFNVCSRSSNYRPFFQQIYGSWKYIHSLSVHQVKSPHSISWHILKGSYYDIICRYDLWRLLFTDKWQRYFIAISSSSVRKLHSCLLRGRHSQQLCIVVYDLHLTSTGSGHCILQYCDRSIQSPSSILFRQQHMGSASNSLRSRRLLV
jgi:hypothetical protein